MKMTAQEKVYALETTGLFVAGLGMMMLVLLSAWVVAVSIQGTRTVTDEIIGNAPRMNLTKADLVGLNGLIENNGRVAGVVDDSAPDENTLRNEIHSWLSDVRKAERLNPAYRDAVLDREAQNYARGLADTCDVLTHSNWEEQIGARIDEGYIVSFAESIFGVASDRFAQELPSFPDEYARLFQQSEALGVGVAKVPATVSCDYPYIVVVRQAAIN